MELKSLTEDFFIVTENILILQNNIYIKKKGKRITKTKTYIYFKYIVGSRDILKCYLRIEYFISVFMSK